MAGDFESISKMVMQSPQGLKLISGLDRFNGALSSESGRQLLELLANDGCDCIKTAAQAAAGAKKDVGRQFVSSLLSTRDGASLLGKIIEVIGM